MLDPTEIIIHCSDSEWGDVEVIDEWHKERGWSGIGYHFVILNGIVEYGGPYRPDLDGKLEIGRSIEKTGAHCLGHNDRSIGVCLIGDHRFSMRQFRSAASLVGLMMTSHGVSLDRVYGHYQFSDKTCPNFLIEDFKRFF